MNRRENTMTLRTVGLYLVLSLLIVGVFTVSLLVVKHGQHSQVATTSESERREDGRYVLASTSTESDQGVFTSSGSIDSGTSASDSEIPVQPRASEQVPLTPSTSSGNQESPVAPVSPAPSAPQQSIPQASSAPQPSAAAAAPEQPSLLGNLLGGVLGILTLR